jgi:hypothetical protein
MQAPMARGIHGLPMVSPRPAMPDPFTAKNYKVMNSDSIWGLIQILDKQFIVIL